MSGRLRHYEPLLMTLQRIGDAILGAGLFLLLSSYLHTYTELYLVATMLIFFMTIVSFNTVGLYRSWRVESIGYEMRHIISGCVGLYILLLTVGYFSKISSAFSRTVVLTWMISWPVLMGLERYVVRLIFRYYRKKGMNFRYAVIAGAGELGMRLVRWIDENPWVGTKVQGFFDDKLTGEVAGFPILGKLTSIPTYLRDNNTDVVYLTLPWRAESKIQRLLKELADSTASIHIIPDIFFFDLIFGGSVTYLGNLPAISLRDTPLRGINSLIKKMEDILLASAILLFTSPIMLIIAIAIKRTSPGPILFKQWRYGLNGHPIRVYKFRTMTVCEDGYTFRQATKCDARVTRVGAFLRRTSLDELPQFINVLQGRMSIVGPRPHPVSLNEEYRKLVPGYMLRHKVKPGITGLAQINGWRGETDTFEKMEQRVEQDLEYLRRWSFVLDLKIIAKTLLNGAWRANAY